MSTWGHFLAGDGDVGGEGARDRIYALRNHEDARERQRPDPQLAHYVGTVIAVVQVIENGGTMVYCDSLYRPYVSLPASQGIYYLSPTRSDGNWRQDLREVYVWFISNEQKTR